MGMSDFTFTHLLLTLLCAWHLTLTALLIFLHRLISHVSVFACIHYLSYRKHRSLEWPCYLSSTTFTMSICLSSDSCWHMTAINYFTVSYKSHILSFLWLQVYQPSTSLSINITTRMVVISILSFILSLFFRRLTPSDHDWPLPFFAWPHLDEENISVVLCRVIFSPQEYLPLPPPHPPLPPYPVTHTKRDSRVSDYNTCLNAQCRVHCLCT